MKRLMFALAAAVLLAVVPVTAMNFVGSHGAQFTAALPCNGSVTGYVLSAGTLDDEQNYTPVTSNYSYTPSQVTVGSNTVSLTFSSAFLNEVGSQDLVADLVIKGSCHINVESTVAILD